MKTLKNTIACTTLMLLATNTFASELTIPNSFTSGTKAVAAEVNANFTAVKSAVDDNNSRLLKMESGRVAVHANAFTVPDNQVGCTNSNSLFHYFSTGTNCNTYAGISLPDNATVTSLACTILDKNATTGSNIQIRLFRTNSQTGASEHVFTTPVSSNNDSVQQISDNTTSIGKIDNSLYYYKLDAFFGTISGGINVRLWGCSVAYSL